MYEEIKYNIKTWMIILNKIKVIIIKLNSIGMKYPFRKMDIYKVN